MKGIPSAICASISISICLYEILVGSYGYAALNFFAFMINMFGFYYCTRK